MAIAVVIEISPAPELEPGLGIALGIELHHLQPVGGHRRDEGDVMLLGHGVSHSDKMLVLHMLHRHAMVLIGLFRFQGRQSDAAAADQGAAGSVDHIAAEGTDLEFAPEHIAGGVLIGDLLAVQQFDDGDAQSLGQGLEQADVRQPLCGLPF